MIKKPNRPLSSLYFLVIVSFLIPLIGLFIYATRYQLTFVFLVIALLINIAFLIAFHKRLAQKQSRISLQKEEYFEKANILKSELEHEWQTIESFRKKIVNYSQLKDLTEKLSASLSLLDTSNTLCSEVNKLFGNKHITTILYLFHKKTGELGISSSQKGNSHINIKSKKGDVFDQWVMKTLQPLLIEDTKTDFRFDVEKIVREESHLIRSLISVPLLLGDKALGIVRVDSPDPHYFVTEDLRFLKTIADLGSIAIENAQLYEHIEDLAIRDSLTGLYLRRYMTERLIEELNRMMRNKKDLSILMIDVDCFKQYNDTFGHTAGDIALKSVAQILSETFLQPGNLIARYGGEEFCVVLPECSKTKAEELAQKVRKKMEDRIIVLRRQDTHITISIGVATFPQDAGMKEELIYKADQALYRAKEQGRNRVCLA